MKTLVKAAKALASVAVVDEPVGPVYEDPFNPHFRSSTPVTISDEQRYYIGECIDVAVSDTQFAAKLKAAIALILRAGEEEVILPPVLTGLTPSTIAVGAPDFVLQVMGSGFTPQSVIHIKDIMAPTTMVSENELTTPIDMALVLQPTTAPITVKNGGAVSNAMDFIVTAPAVFTAPTPAA